MTTTSYDRLDSYEAYRLGELMLGERQPREAARALRVVVERAPDHAAAWELLGRAHFAAAHLERAEEAFRRLVDLEPTSGWAHAALARSLDRQSRSAVAAVLHRLAAALGESVADGSRVDLVDPGPDDRPLEVDLSDRLGG